MPQYNDCRDKHKGWAILEEKALKEKIRTALFISDAMEKIFIIFKLLDEASEGLEEIEKELKDNKKSITKFSKNV